MRRRVWTSRQGLLAEVVEDQLRPYLVHRSTGRPYVVLKLAATLDGRTAAPDGSSRWITGAEARRDLHRLRAESDAVLVGAGTLRRDDPELSVRGDGSSEPERQPLRVVLGRVPAGARARPALELGGDLGAVLDELGRRGVLQLLVEGGAHVAHAFHNQGLVDRYVWYLAPAFLGGDDGFPVFAGPGVPTMAQAWRGRLVVGGPLRRRCAHRRRAGPCPPPGARGGRLAAAGPDERRVCGPLGAGRLLTGQGGGDRRADGEHRGSDRGDRSGRDGRRHGRRGPRERG